MRSPILCIDNGTQRINNTWVVIPKRMYSGNGEFTGITCIESDKSFSFSHARAQSVFTINNIYELSINNEALLLMKIEHFKAAFYGGDN